MDNYCSLQTKCLVDKKEIMNNKEKYAKLFSEGRKSLERLLLTCYDNNIMSNACCSGHIFEVEEESLDYFNHYSGYTIKGKNLVAEESYLNLLLLKKDFGIISGIIDEYKSSDLNRLCKIERFFLLRGYKRKYFDFCIRAKFDDADNVYNRIIEIIMSKKANKNISIDLELLNILKNELINYRKRVLPKYSRDYFFSIGVEIVDSDGKDSYEVPGKYLTISRLYDLPQDYKSLKNPDNIVNLIRYINDNDEIDYNNTVNRYLYEDDSQLEELKRVLLKKKR